MISKKALAIYDLTAVSDEEDAQVPKLIPPILSWDMENQTYDEILEAYIDEADVDSSWIVLSSKTFGYIQIIRLRDLPGVVRGTGKQQDKEVLTVFRQQGSIFAKQSEGKWSVRHIFKL